MVTAILPLSCAKLAPPVRSIFQVGVEVELSQSQSHIDWDSSTSTPTWNIDIAFVMRKVGAAGEIDIPGRSRGRTVPIDMALGFDAFEILAHDEIHHAG